MQRSKPLVLSIVIVLLLIAAILLLRAVQRETPTLPESGAAAPAPVASRNAEAAAEPEAVEERTALLADPKPTSDAATLGTDERSYLDGVVIDESRKPVPGAEVTLFVRPAVGYELLIDFDYSREEHVVERTTTDASGKFRFDVEPARSYGLRARADGWSPTEVAGVGAGPPLEIVLARGADVSVRAVRASDAVPVAGARVVLMHDVIEVNLETLTDARGMARFSALPPGAAWVQVIPAVEAARGADVDLVAGRDTPVVIEIKDGHTVEGTVRERGTGRPIADAEVSAWDFYAKSVRTDAAGHYRITGIDPGGADHRTISARARGYGRVDRRVDLATGVVSVCDVELKRGLSVRGRTVRPDGSPIVDVYVAAVGSSFEAGLRVSDDARARSGADGSFEVADVSRELPHVLFLRAQGHETRTLDVPIPATAAEVVDVGVLILAQGAAVEGRVLTAAEVPVARALIVLTALVASTQAVNTGLSMQQVRTDVHGRFRVADLASGGYAIRVVSQGAPDLNSELTLSAGEVRRGLELVLAGGGVLAGQVVDERGAGVRDAEVHVSTPGSTRWAGRCRTTADGSFRIEGLPDEDLRIGAQLFEQQEGPGGEIVRLLPSAEINVRPWTTDLRILLPTAGVIEGRVLAADGTALVGGAVEAFDAGGKVVGNASARDGDFLLLVPAGATVRLVGYRRTLENGRFRRVEMPGEQAVVESVTAGARDVIVRFAKRP